MIASLRDSDSSSEMLNVFEMLSTSGSDSVNKTGMFLLIVSCSERDSIRDRGIFLVIVSCRGNVSTNDIEFTLGESITPSSRDSDSENEIIVLTDDSSDSDKVSTNAIDNVLERGHCTTLKEYPCVSPESDCQKLTVLESASVDTILPFGCVVAVPPLEFDVNPKIEDSSVP